MTEFQETFRTGDGRDVSVDEIATLYRDVVSYSVPTSGKIKPISGTNNYILTANYETLNCDQLDTKRTSKSHLLSTRVEGAKYTTIESVHPVAETNSNVDVILAQSETGQYLARVSSSTKDSEKKQILDIWNESKLIRSIDVSQLEIHGPINTDPVFGSIRWSRASGDKLLYVCQKKRPKYPSFFKQASSKCSDEATPSSNGAKPRNSGLDRERVEDWGECLGDIDHTILAILDVGKDCKITVIDIDGFSLGDAQWIDESRTVSVAYPEEPRRLGLIYCNSRPSFLVVNDAITGQELFRIQSDTDCYTSPRVSHLTQKLVYASAPIYGAHRHSQRLHSYDLKTNLSKELVDSRTGQSAHFLHGCQLPKECFVAGDSGIVFVREDCYKDQLSLYDFTSSTLIDIDFPTPSIRILDVNSNLIFATGSNINQVPSLFVASVSSYPKSPELSQLEWHSIDETHKFDEVTYEPFKIPTSDEASFISGVLITPHLKMLHDMTLKEKGSQDSASLVVKENNLPTVVLIHGGPHGAYTMQYIPSLIIYARLGLRVLIVNYRGSSGVSEQYIESLSGRVGERDVNDCLLAIRHFVQKGIVDQNKLIVQGGSHGGFLSAHLSCQREFKFTSAILRNPVIDLSTLHTSSDIPDWCYSVAFGSKSYDHTWLPSPQELTKLYECSPVYRYREASVPTLMLLGNQDKRVPMFQGERWYQLLKARGVKTQCKIYDDKHSLDKPETAPDSIMTAIMWILRNLKPEAGDS